MAGELENLLKLQDFIFRRQQKIEQRDTLPPELEGVDREFREKSSAIETLRKHLAETERGHRAAEGKLAELAEKQKKYQAQLMGVKNQREYGALLNELDGVKREVRAAEDEALERLEALEAIRKDLSERESSYPQDQAAHEAALAGWRQTQSDIDREIEAISRDIAEIEKAFPPRQLAELRRLFDRRGGQAVVRTSGPSCPACHVRLRPALYQSLRTSHEIVTCDSCKRILVYAEEAAAS